MMASVKAKYWAVIGADNTPKEALALQDLQKYTQLEK